MGLGESLVYRSSKPPFLCVRQVGFTAYRRPCAGGTARDANEVISAERAHIF
jgi:hypothetical protein